MSAAGQYAVRRRGDGWVVWDTTERMVRGSIHATEDAAWQAAAEESIPKHTYGITWYVEVDAADEAAAVALATKMFIARQWRDLEPVSVEGPLS